MGVIKSGDSGDVAAVNPKKQLTVFSVVESVLEFVSDKDKTAYTWHSVPYSSSAADTIFAVKNISADKALHIEFMHIHNGSVATRYDIHLVTVDYTSAGQERVGVNMNSGSSNTADAEAYEDETNNVKGAIIHTPYMAIDSNLSIRLDGIILAKNDAIAIDVIEGSVVECSIAVVGHFE